MRSVFGMRVCTCLKRITETLKWDNSLEMKIFLDAVTSFSRAVSSAPQTQRGSPVKYTHFWAPPQTQRIQNFHVATLAFVPETRSLPKCYDQGSLGNCSQRQFFRTHKEGEYCISVFHMKVIIYISPVLFPVIQRYFK